MTVFLSHIEQDRKLAREIAVALRAAGFEVWSAEEQILPGDNFAGIISKALESSNAMVVLLTPAALSSEYIRREIEFALGNPNYSHRLIPVFIGSEDDLASADVPWILRQLEWVHITDPGDPRETESAIERVANALTGSPSGR